MLLTLTFIAALLPVSTAAQQPQPAAPLEALAAQIEQLPDIDDARRDQSAGARWNEVLTQAASLGPAAVNRIAVLTFSGRDPRSRRNAGAVLAFLADGVRPDKSSMAKVSLDSMFEYLPPMLWSRHTEARLAGASLIGRFSAQSVRHLPWLLLLLTDDNVSVREAGLRAFRAIGPAAKDAIPVIQQFHLDAGNNATLRQAAEEALRSLGGAPPAASFPGRLLLLPGYVHDVGQGFDSAVGSLSKPNGPQIHYDLTGMASDHATPIVENAQPHLWAKLQVIGGHFARIVMLEDGKLLVGFFFVPGTFQASNIRTPEDLAEVLLIIASYEPRKF